LALKGAGFATSDKVAAAIREGVAAELADAVMASLGSRFERLSDEDVRILAELYTAAPSAAMTTANAVMEPGGPNVLAERETGTPHLPVEAGGDEVAGSPTPSVVVALEGKGTISSPEDDSSTDESHNGDGPEEKAGQHRALILCQNGGHLGDGLRANKAEADASPRLRAV
jgi:hypothetical protein